MKDENDKPVYTIDNSYEAAVKTGKWVKPGAKFYNTLAGSEFHFTGSDKTADAVREAYLIVSDKYHANSKEPMSMAEAGCKYPHHVLQGDKLVVSIPGIKAAYSRAKQCGVYSGKVKSHLMKHYKEMGLYKQSTMKENFEYIESTINSILGTDLHEFTEDDKLWPDIKSPDELLEWMDCIKYDSSEKWKLRSAEEVVKSKKGNCHDQSLFAKTVLAGLGFRTGQVFFIEYKNGSDIGGKTHTLTWFRAASKDHNKTGLKFYWFEHAWEQCSGIHGPYDSIKSIKKAVIKEWKKEKSGYDGIKFYQAKYITGMTLDQYVRSCQQGDEFSESAKTGGLEMREEKCLNEHNMSYPPGIKVTFSIDGTDIGSCCISRLNRDPFLYKFSVKEDQRGKGYDRTMLEAVIDKYGVNELNVDRDNDVAMKLYKSCGFRVAGELKEKNGRIYGYRMLRDNDSEFDVDQSDTTNPNDYVSHQAVRLKFTADGQYIGTCCISAVGTDRPFLYEFEVAEEKRSQGYGRKIMEYVLDHFYVKELTVDCDNDIAINLYKSLGFDVVKQYNDDGVDRLYMRLNEDTIESLSEWVNCFVNSQLFRDSIIDEPNRIITGIKEEKSMDDEWIWDMFMEAAEANDDPPTLDDQNNDQPAATEDQPEETNQQDQSATEEQPTEEPEQTETEPEESEEEPTEDETEEPETEDEPAEEETPEEPEQPEAKPIPPVKEKISLPQQADREEHSKNGRRRKNLYIGFIKWAKQFNSKNSFGSIFDKDAFKVSYPFVPEEMRYFYRLANPLICVLSGNLTFFSVCELRKINSANKKLSEMMIFAATEKDLRVFNNRDKKVYLAEDNNGEIVLKNILANDFDYYLQSMMNLGNYLTGPDVDLTKDDEAIMHPDQAAES